jgi:hypothetical protein
VAEVNVEVAPCLRNHNVVVVPVAHAHHVSGDAVPGARPSEEVNGLMVLLVRRIVIPNEVVESGVLVCTKLATVLHVDLFVMQEMRQGGVKIE